jgi:hypothetical protein
LSNWVHPGIAKRKENDMSLRFRRASAFSLIAIGFVACGQSALAQSTDLACSTTGSNPTAVVHLDPNAGTAAFGSDSVSRANVTDTQISWDGSTQYGDGYTDHFVFDRYTAKLSLSHPLHQADGSWQFSNNTYTCSKGAKVL